MTSPTFRVVVLSVLGCEARGAPNRALTLHCEMTNPGTGAFYIADAWLEVKLAGGPIIAEGRLFHGLYNMVDPALVWRRWQVHSPGGNCNPAVCSSN